MNDADAREYRHDGDENNYRPGERHHNFLNRRKAWCL